MTVRFRCDGNTGRAAIFTGEDRAPFNAPRDHMDRVRFHSDLDYPRVLAERTVTVSLPRIGTPLKAPFFRQTKGTHTQSFTLFSHGRPGIPWVLASARIGAEDVAFTGSVPVSQSRRYNGALSSWGRWLSVGADASRVYAYQYCVVQWDKDTDRSFDYFPAINIPITVWITDTLL